MLLHATEHLKPAVEKAQSARKKYATAEEIPDEELPDNFDWRNIGGYNFAGPVKD